MKFEVTRLIVSEQQPDTLPQSPATVVSAWKQWLLSAIPFVLTAFVSVALTLLVQAALPISREPHPVSQSADLDASMTSMHMSMLAYPETQPITPTVVLTSTRPISQEIVELRREISNLWSAYYLARAASQLADAEAALRVNDLSEVEQVLITVDASLDRAYERSAEQDKGPINEFRLQVGRMHENLRVRPERMDQKLRRLRQSMLSLVDEGS
jgi:hypothetical protein